MDGRKLSWDGALPPYKSPTSSSKIKKFLRRLVSSPREDGKSTASERLDVEVLPNPRPGVFKPDRRQPGPQASEYYESHNSRGKVYIFNHVTFKRSVPTRDGAMKDVENLLENLPKLGFLPENIKCFQDLPLADVDEKLDEISKEDHEDSDMLMMFILTHGENEGKIYAHDREYGVQDIWQHFTANKCPTLKGKPKIFFIIACRGDKVDDGETVTVQPTPRKLSVTETDAVRCRATPSYKIPVWADFLIVYSTMEGYYSYRNTTDGTWYVQAFCQELKNFKDKNMHFMDFLTGVNRRVAIQYATLFDDPKMNNKKQCPFITSSLTKIIYLKLGSKSKGDDEEAKLKERPKSLNT